MAFADDYVDKMILDFQQKAGKKLEEMFFFSLKVK